MNIQDISNNKYFNDNNNKIDIKIPHLEINNKNENDINNKNNENSNINEKLDNNELGNENIINLNNNVNYNDNEFDYSEVLPIIDKVSKLKELNELEEDFDNQKNNNLNSQRTKLTNINIIPNSNEDDDVPNIVNSILDALSNKLIESNLDYNKEKDEKNKDEETDINKPKLISKNKNIEGKQTKIISFQEFLEKEEKNNI